MAELFTFLFDCGKLDLVKLDNEHLDTAHFARAVPSPQCALRRTNHMAAINENK